MVRYYNYDKEQMQFYYKVIKLAFYPLQNFIILTTKGKRHG